MARLYSALAKAFGGLIEHFLQVGFICMAEIGLQQMGIRDMAAQLLNHAIRCGFFHHQAKCCTVGPQGIPHLTQETIINA